MGRAPCCEKAKVKRGPWSPEEDSILKSYLHSHGTGGNWISFPAKAGLKRCGRSCRLRWLNYLRPDIKHGGFTPEEDLIISTYYTQIGSRWSVIASQLQGRTDNDIKNYWNTKLKKKLLVGNTVPSKDNLNNNESISNRNLAGDSITSLSPNYSSSSSSSPLISSPSVPKNEPFLVSTPPASSATTWYGLNPLHDYSTDNYHPALYRPILPPADLDRTISVVSQEGSCISSDSSSLAAGLPTDQDLGFGSLNYDIWYPNMPDLSLNARYAEG